MIRFRCPVVASSSRSKTPGHTSPSWPKPNTSAGMANGGGSVDADRRARRRSDDGAYRDDEGAAPGYAESGNGTAPESCQRLDALQNILQSVNVFDFVGTIRECPRCHEPRMLHSKTEAGPSRFEYRTFDCQKCGRTHTMIIASDPMESNVRGWLDGALGAPV
jgi:hypothetical protein